MARYLVTMDLPAKAAPDGALPPIEGLLGTLRETILPTLEPLSALKERGVVLDEGYTSGKRSIMVIVEADSEERAREMLEGVPGWVVEITQVSRLHTLDELSDRRRSRAHTPLRAGPDG